MAVETPDFYFAAPPKAGCRWTRSALLEVFGKQVLHGSLHSLPGDRDRPLLSILRDPADWARSWFQNINCPLDCPADRFLPFSRGESEPDDQNFRRFVDLYVASGLSVGEMFADYRPDHVFRIEDAPAALENFLGRPLGKHDRRRTRRPLKVPADVREMIYDHEREYCQLWGYSR